MKQTNEQSLSMLYLSSYVGKEDIFYAPFTYKKYEAVPLHSHDFYEIFLLAKGQILHFYNGKQSLLEKGAIQLIKPLDIHRLEGAGEYDNLLYNFAFSKNLFDKITENTGKDFNNENYPLLQLTLYQFETLLDKINLFRKKNISLYNCLFSLFLDYIIFSSRYNNKQNAKVIPPWLRRSIKEMETIENLRIGLSKFVELSGKSQEHLSRTMRDCFNITATQWINSHRLELSRRQLITTNHSILEIMFDVGFESESYFYRLFKKYFRQTPHQYRVEINKNDI